MHLWEFARAVFGHWESLMFGAVAAGLLWFLTWIWSKRTHDKKLPWYIYAWIVLIFCFVGSYQAWVDKYDELEIAVSNETELKGKLESKKAKLTVGYYNAYWIPEFSVLVALVHIGNAGGSPSIAHDFEMTIGGSKVRPLINKPTPLFHVRFDRIPDKTDMMLLGEEFIQHRAMERPIQQGTLVRGWIVFELSTVVPKCSHAQVGTLTLKDINDVKYMVAIAAQEIPPLPASNTFAGYPDITFPFLPRDIIQNVKRGRRGDSATVHVNQICEDIKKGS